MQLPAKKSDHSPNQASNASEGCIHAQKNKSGNLDAQLFRVDPDLIQTDSEENLRGFIKTRGSLIPGEEFVFWWVGDIYDLRDGEASKHLFSFEGYNIGRMVRVEGGWRMLTREVGLYKDKDTGEILGTWENPHTGKTNQCVHVWNDPVNQQFLLNGSRGKFKVPTTVQGEDVYWHAEVFLKYPSPLPREEYPENAASDFYQSAEMFQFFSSRSELSSNQASADCMISWVRVGQWLPWMEMGDRPGRMVYHCRGRKLKEGYAGLSENVRKYVEKHHPEYAQAPLDFKSPNETSWTYMRKLLGNKGPRADGTIARPEPEVVELTASTGNGRAERLSISKEELRAYNGVDTGKPIFLSVNGRIFDVSSARRHYRLGETYNCLTGRDCSLAFVKGNLEAPEIGKSVVDAMSEKERQDLRDWEGFFEKNYPEVGLLVDF